MPSYRIRILDGAARELGRLDKPVARRITRRIRWLGENLQAGRPEPLTAIWRAFSSCGSASTG